DLLRHLVSMSGGIVLHNLHAAAMTMHIAEAADVHQDVEAELLPGAEGARNFVMTAAMTQAQIDDLSSLRFGQSIHNLANLPVGMVGMLVEQRGSQFHLQRVVVEQVDQRHDLDGGSPKQFPGSGN